MGPGCLCLVNPPAWPPAEPGPRPFDLDAWAVVRVPYRLDLVAVVREPRPAPWWPPPALPGARSALPAPGAAGRASLAVFVFVIPGRPCL